MKCPTCGTQIKPTNWICGNCQKKLLATNLPARPRTTASTATAQPQTSTHRQTPTHAKHRLRTTTTRPARTRPHRRKQSMASRNRRQNQHSIRQPPLGQSMEANTRQPTHPPQHANHRRRLPCTTTHHPTQQPSPHASRRHDTHRHLPPLRTPTASPTRRTHSNLHVRRRMAGTSHQSRTRPQTLGTANHRHTSRRRQRTQTLRPIGITQPHKPMAPTRQLARHADKP
ncbi:hypothetical protein BMOU_0782 [Bifidobacterium moukalabense DSM 27321]|uniref:Uncharacterized protein n=1 Tax=Bifidobacterium moukalabense DSM 27321 TaxID=1435051 RepID=W4N9H1_9BIFI|nr:hypothetical protein BMOU_0782 [Bifidobacterium moukalabense DSM 27321]